MTSTPARPGSTDTNTGGAGGSDLDCPNQCARVYAPVCGSDGETYFNPCLLNVVACRENRRITVQSQGRCGKKSNVVQNYRVDDLITRKRLRDRYIKINHNSHCK